MARLSGYPLDTNLSDGDYLLGNDIDDTGGIATKRFSLEDIKTFVNIGIDVLQSSPGGYVPIVTDDGENLRASQIVQELGERQGAAVAFVTDPTDDPLYLNGQILPNGTLTDGTNGPIIEIWDYRQPFALSSFNGRSFVMTVAGGTHVGTIGAMIGDPITIERGGVENVAVFRFAVTVTSDEDIIQENWQSITIGTGGVGDSLQRITLILSADVSIESLLINTATVSEELHITGSLYIDGTAGGMSFGESPVGEDPPDFVSFTTDGTNLTFGGDGAVNITNTTTFSGRIDIDPGPLVITDSDDNTLTISGTDIQFRDDIGDLPDHQIRRVTGNVTSGTPQGPLTSIHIGDDNYTVPQLSSGLASALPGLNTELAGPEIGITIGRFFVGTEQGSGALFQNDPVLTTGSTQTVNAGETANQLGSDTGGNAAFITALRDLIDNLDPGNNVFFVSSGYTLAFPAVGIAIPESIMGGLFEIVSFDDGDPDENTIIFGRLGGGQLNIFTEQLQIDSDVVSISSIPVGTATNFMYYDPTSTPAGQLSHAPLDISGRANGARFDFDGATDVPATSMEFVGNHNISRSGGDITIDITGKYTRSGARTTAFPAAPFNVYYLDDTTSQQTITLPQGNVGDSIKFVNRGENSDWRAIPATGERIGGQAVNEELILNNTSNFELIYNSTALGWIIF